MRFRGIIQLSGKTATGIEVPAEVVTNLGAGKHPLVRVTIGDYSYRSSVAAIGGKFMLPISAENRAGAGVAAGDEVNVELELDTAPREVAVPSDFQQALDADADVKRRFEGLSTSNKRRHILSIEGAKIGETRQRRIDKAISELREA